MKSTNNNWAKLVVQAWKDEDFKRKLMQNPQEVCKEHGVNIPQGATVKVYENSAKMIHLVIPQKPTQKLSDEEMLKIAAAVPRGPGGGSGSPSPTVG